MTVYYYGRCSAQENFDKGSSLATQLSKCKSYANIKDLMIDEIYEEQSSGTIPFEQREKGFVIMKSLKAGDHIICSALDRFGRNTLNLLMLVERFRQKKVKLHFIDIGGEVTGSDAIGSVFLKLLSVFAEFYSAQLGEKQKATKDRMKTEGKHRGGLKMFGYDVDENNYLVPCVKEQATISLMKMLRTQGKTYREISVIVTRSTRKKFSHSWVHKILKREESNLLPSISCTNRVIQVSNQNTQHELSL